MRLAMVRETIEDRGIRDERVLDAMRSVPRHRFVSESLHSEAYNDYPLSIGQNQTISQPYIVALMTELLELKGDEKVLEIGAGCGYQAAVLSLLAREVYTIEIVESLALSAAERLKDLGYANVQVRAGDGSLGWPETAPFDGIIVTAAAPRLPEALVAQLKDGGRLVIPMGAEHETQILRRYVRQGKELTQSDIDAVRFVPMRGAIER
jgi:protein-L-isoaspartate(D-aspartate) O-methyltransferase